MSQKSPAGDLDDVEQKVLRKIKASDDGLYRQELADEVELSEDETNTVVNYLADRGELNITVDWKYKSRD
jgi:orotate phosphoribosyltransferase-like protein